MAAGGWQSIYELPSFFHLCVYVRYFCKKKGEVFIENEVQSNTLLLQNIYPPS